MAIQGTDYLVINLGGVDYKALVSTLPEFDSTELEALIAANAQAISDLEGVVADNTTDIATNTTDIATNTTNIATNTTDIATNAAAIATNAGNITSNTTNISSNATDISNLETALSSLELDDLTDVNTTGSADQVLTLLADGSFGFTTIAIPKVINPKGFIDVTTAAPADPVHGDTYIQHRDDEADAVAEASFVGIAGDTISEGTFVIYGIDDEWHAGGNANSTQVQSDWSETDQTSPAFIKNKPLDLSEYAKLDDNTQSITAKEFIGDGSKLTGLPSGFSGDYNDLINKPTVNDGQLQLQDPTGATKVTFSANQAGNQTASVYLKDSYIQNLPTLP